MTTTSSLGGILNIARQGLFGSQVGIQTAGQNISNVNTPGYTRQRVIYDPGAFSNGVQVQTIQQVRNRFLDSQLAAEKVTLGLATARSTVLSQLEMIFNESDGFGISTSLSEFFASLQDLSAQPDGSGQREALRSRVVALGQAFTSVRTRVEQTRTAADDQVKSVISEVNILTSEIASLNALIIQQTTVSQEPNELLDQRQRAIEELSQLVEITYFEDHGQLTVLLSGEQVLVEGSGHSTLRAQVNLRNEGMSDVILERFDGVSFDITDRVVNGELGGLLEMRDTVIPNQLRQIDLLAAQFVTELNIQHRQGRGLDGVGNRDLFGQVEVVGRADEDNAGGVLQTGQAILDQSLLTFHDYEIQFTGAGTYDLVDATTGTVLSTGNVYTPGGSIVFDGLSITLDSMAGAPVAGDVIHVNTYEGMAGQVELSAAVAADLQAIAAGLTAEPGDNANALAMADLENALVLGGGTMTFGDLYGMQITTLGVESQRAERELETQQLVVDQVSSLVASVSGVSLDEESTSLIQFERAYQASSQVIAVVDELLQTLLSIV
ncbi:flagellar hook-associated protein FlgK [Candidatus Sumerlaeota bacterium]|nr:flagellar hook-associated protein FlgK [Candidatus Sumerlaeota bacterium]